jgi:hypothetical protein
MSEVRVPKEILYKLESFNERKLTRASLLEAVMIVRSNDGKYKRSITQVSELDIPMPIVVFCINRLLTILGRSDLDEKIAREDVVQAFETFMADNQLKVRPPSSSSSSDDNAGGSSSVARVGSASVHTTPDNRMKQHSSSGASSDSRVSSSSGRSQVGDGRVTSQSRPAPFPDLDTASRPPRQSASASAQSLHAPTQPPASSSSSQTQQRAQKTDPPIDLYADEDKTAAITLRESLLSLSPANQHLPMFHDPQRHLSPWSLVEWHPTPTSRQLMCESFWYSTYALFVNVCDTKVPISRNLQDIHGRPKPTLSMLASRVEYNDADIGFA